MSFTTTISGTGPAVSAAAAPNLESRSFTIPAVDPGFQLYMRNKHLAGATSFAPDKTLLFLHGATYPAETSFDLAIDGVSMMDLFARAGFDVYLLDVRGYGGSTRPPEMDQPAADNKPVVSSVDAGNDLGAAVDYILSSRDIPKLNLMGWSWGTSIAGAYTASHNDRVDRLVLYDPAWLVKPTVAPKGAVLPAYRLVSKESALARWMHPAPEDKQAQLIPPGVFEAWWNATLATDPVGSRMTPPALRACNGVGEELVNFWLAGKPYYDPGKIEVPTLVIHVEWEADPKSAMAENYFEQLIHASHKRIVRLMDCTHMVIMEKNRMQLFEEVFRFLTEGAPAA
jgi:pimeloyl-ACP methyl ester carboxylesterase